MHSKRGNEDLLDIMSDMMYSGKKATTRSSPLAPDHGREELDPMIPSESDYVELKSLEEHESNKSCKLNKIRDFPYTPGLSKVFKAFPGPTEKNNMAFGKAATENKCNTDTETGEATPRSSVVSIGCKSKLLKQYSDMMCKNSL